MTTDERVIIQRCKQGETGAFNDLVKRYEKQVYNFAYRLTGNYDDANDISQDALIRVCNAIQSFRGDASFTTWIYRITTNVFLDERKRARAHPHSSLDEHVDLEESTIVRQIEDPSPQPLAQMEEKELGVILQRAVAALPEYQRAMVLLYHTEQKSYEEIAEIMNLPIGTVKSRLNRARLALKDILAPERELFGD